MMTGTQIRFIKLLLDTEDTKSLKWFQQRNRGLGLLHQHGRSIPAARPRSVQRLTSHSWKIPEPTKTEGWSSKMEELVQRDAGDD